ncbi:unnamed protein product [Schistosoma turkestanicum]|nr:unnamed protein product [Schistosoma turkestanicum]
MDNRIPNNMYDRIMVPPGMHSTREIDASDLHRINPFQPNNNSFLYQEILNSNTSTSSSSSSLITGLSRPTLENNILDSMNSSKTLYDNNSFNHKPTLNQYLEQSTNLLPFMYPNTSTDNMMYHYNTHQECLSSPKYHFNHSDMINSSFTSSTLSPSSSSTSISPSLASKRFRNNLTRSTPNWTCLCSHQLDEMNEYRKIPMKLNVMKHYTNESNNLRQNEINLKRIHRTHEHHIRSNDNNLINLSASSLSSSSSTSSPSSTSFECARSFIRLRNARERERVRCVNAGYESLRRHLPLTILPDRRLAKVEILRGAIHYINTLKELLEK